ncbi:MAG: nicotinamidase [Thermoproteota archaeon]
MPPTVKIDSRSALIVVDVQNDFMPNGALPVRNGDKVVEPLNKYIELFEKNGGLIVFTRDWHPPNHVSFKNRGGPWPSHCVKGTRGAEFHHLLRIPRDAVIVSKADEPDKEAYSGFQGTKLASILRERKVEKVFIGGLATDYCVKSTVLDALRKGFKTYFLSDASQGVDVNAGDSKKAVEKMVKNGAVTIVLKDLY